MYDEDCNSSLQAKFRFEENVTFFCVFVPASFDSTLSAQTVQGCGVGNTPLPYPMSQDGTPVLDTGMACTQWPGEYSPYPMMASETGTC